MPSALKTSPEPSTFPARRRNRAPSFPPKAARPSRQRAPPLPVSAHPPVKLHRPLEVFGRSFLVHMSTPLTFSPDTALRAVVDMSLQTAIRTWQPSHHQLLKKLSYIAKGKHKISQGTKDLTVGDKDFARLVAPGITARILDGEQLPVGPPSDWAAVLIGLEGDEETVFHDVATCLAACDAQVFHIQALARVGRGVEGQAYLETLIAPAVEPWKAAIPGLDSQVLMLVEIALKTLAWLECRLDPPAGGHNAQLSGVAGLLDPGHRPLGNWLREVYQASGCKDLEKLSRKLEWKDTYLGRPIKYGLLRRWSGSLKVAMPQAALQPVLSAVLIKERAQTLDSRFYVARMFTFLCDLVRAGTQGTAPPWEEVQALIKSRHAEAHRLEVEQLHAGIR